MAFKRRFAPRKKYCRFCADKTLKIDYKNPDLLKDYVTERGKIIAQRITGNCAKCQRRMTTAIKRSRQMALLYYTTVHATYVRKKTI